MLECIKRAEKEQKVATSEEQRLEWFDESVQWRTLVVWMLLKRGMGNGEWGMGNGEWGMGNGEWGMGMRNEEWGMGNGKLKNEKI